MTPGEQPRTTHEPHRVPSPVAGILSYLVPGLGQIYDGRTGKGLLFMFTLLGMFFLGQAMGDWQNVYLPPLEQGRPNGDWTAPLQSVYNRWHYAGQFWIGIAAWPAVMQFYAENPPEWLHNYQRAPTDWEQNQKLVNTDKGPDLGW